MQTPELGWGIRSIGRGLKKVAKKTVKATIVAPTKFVVKSHVALAKISAKLALLPLKYLTKAVITLGRTLCKAPPLLLEQVAQANGIDRAFVPAFCQAVAVNKWNMAAIKRFLPTALKLAMKLGASGAFPPIVPAMQVVKRIPFMSRFAGADLGSYASDLRNPLLKRSIKTLEMYALSDHLGLMDADDAAALGLGDADREVMQGFLQGEVDAAAGKRNAAWALALSVAGLAIFYLATHSDSE